MTRFPGHASVRFGHRPPPLQWLAAEPGAGARYKQRMTKTPLVVLAAACAVLALAFVLNPSPERHRARIQDSLGARSPVARMLGLGSVAGFLSNYHSLGVASYTRVGDRTLSVGAFGIVVVRD